MTTIASATPGADRVVKANGAGKLPAGWFDPAVLMPLLAGDITAAVDEGIATHTAGADPHTQYQRESEKGAANGYAGLDATGKVPTAQLPSVEQTANKGAANGYAGLDATGKVPTAQLPSLSTILSDNLIINGAFNVNQRRLGTVTPAATQYVIDRWKCRLSGLASKLTFEPFTSGAPAGFGSYLKATVATSATPGSTDYAVLEQSIEGYNCDALKLGTADAATITISFYALASVALNNVGISLSNAAGNRCYLGSVSIAGTGTWARYTATLTLDTSGTWAAGKSAGLVVAFSLGAGSSACGTAGSWGATVYRGVTGQTNFVAQTTGSTLSIAGVQLEIGSTATPAILRSFSHELILCQRYFQKSFHYDTAPAQNVNSTAGALIVTAQVASAQYVCCSATLPVVQRDYASLTTYNPFYAGAGWSASGAGNYTASAYSTGDGAITVRCDQAVSLGSQLSIHWTSDVDF